MNQNVAPLERVLRVMVGLVFLSLALAGPQTIWGLLGLIPLITGATGHCPVYQALDMSDHSPTSRRRAAH